jgi:hypothetical protein
MRVQERLATLAEVEHGLEGVLRRLLRQPGKWALVMSTGDHGPFIQWMVYPDGRLLCEVSSSQFLRPDQQLTIEDEVRLLELGWLAPEPSDDNRPNLLREAPRTGADGGGRGPGDGDAEGKCSGLAMTTSSR